MDPEKNEENTSEIERLHEPESEIMSHQLEDVESQLQELHNSEMESNQNLLDNRNEMLNEDLREILEQPEGDMVIKDHISPVTTAVMEQSSETIQPHTDSDDNTSKEQAQDTSILEQGVENLEPTQETLTLKPVEKFSSEETITKESSDEHISVEALQTPDTIEARQELETAKVSEESSTAEALQELAAADISQDTSSTESQQDPNLTSEVIKVVEGPHEPTKSPEVVEEPTMIAEVEQEPTMIAEGAQDPTMIAEGVQDPTMIEEGVQEPTMIAEGAQEPTMIAEGSQEPTMIAEGAQEPTMIAEGVQEPTVIAEGAQEPITITENAQESPKEVVTDQQIINANPEQLNEEKTVASPKRTEQEPNSPVHNVDQEGSDAGLCIIPDTQREISQAEKDAASTIPPLRDISETNAGQKESTVDVDAACPEQNVDNSIRILKYDKEDLQLCQQCKLNRKANYYYKLNQKDNLYICDDTCLGAFKESQNDKVVCVWDEGNLRVKNFVTPNTNKDPTTLSFVRKCASCKKNIENTETNLTWEIMDFCDEFCLTKYQKEIGSYCASCQGEVRSNSLGKYCVRFGNDIRQFCTSACLEKYKKGLKVCSYCQQDMSGGTQGFLAPVGDKGQFKDFCSQQCMEKYDIMTNDKPPNVPVGTSCSVCKATGPMTIEYELEGKMHYCCREPCFVAFSFVNNVASGKCAMCKRNFPQSILEKHTMFYDNTPYSFCSTSCENIYIIAHRKIVPCSWCKVKKYNFDMIRRYSPEGTVINMCSINCLNLYKVSVNAVSSKQISCSFCQKLSHPMYHLTMSDATVRNFCSYACVMSFQGQFSKQQIIINNLQESYPVPTGLPRKNKKHPSANENGPQIGDAAQLPIISSVQSLATNGSIGPPKSVSQAISAINTRTTRSKAATAVASMLNSNQPIVNSFADLPVQVQIKQHFIVKPAPLPDQRNVGTMCYTKKTSKSVTAKPQMVDQAVQTDEKEASKVIIPIPMPVYVPTPMHMYTNLTPMPVPIPIPIPVPVFIPTTSNSSAGIMKQIKKLQVIPSDPYEAEILMMAEMVAEEKKEDTTDSESDVDDTAGPEDSYSPEPVDTNNTFGDDVLQMALKMASELDEPAVDLEGALTANTITAPQGGESQEENVDDPQPMHPMIADRSPSVRGRKRGMRQARGGAKRGRRMSHHQVDMPMMQQIAQPPPPPEPMEKPDANMCLKFTFGVNAWKQWVTTKNAELEKQRRVKLFKTEILQLTADELNYSLCLFVKEVRKPNGAEYAPDTIYYLCLGIQQYLFENGRIDNIFCDPYYEKFTDCLDEVAKKFSVLYNDSHYIVTRVEEEHLWESKQLGAHSPHVLLSTLMFFNTKHFNLTTVDEHMQLSFSHIMKHWKRNPNQPGAAKVPGSRNVLLRFYPPQSAIQNNARKKKVYEQQENEENPLRCPVKLYEFYLSKCPESVKTRNDVFYLQPERSCIPDSPVWYSTMPLPKEALEKMLHRVKMVKEINVALLTS